MKKVLVFCAGHHGAQEGLQLDEAIEQYKQGNEVTFLSCDENIGGCNENREFNKNICKFCKLIQKRNRKKNLPSEIKQIKIGDFVTSSLLKQANIEFSYDDVDSLRKIKFHGVEIGLAALSSYISFTRDIDPEINSKTKQYFDRLLKSQIILTLVVEKLQTKNKFDLFILHNGRFAIFKPILNIAQNNRIDYICTESYQDAHGHVIKDYYYNETPHNIGPRTVKFIQAWDEAKINKIDRENVGKSFFERRRNSESTGDKIYTSKQDNNTIIENWDENKQNIVIFNSSEDEFTAVRGDFEKGKLFPSQLCGIKAILDHYKEDRTKHFYLRIHPNLTSVQYSYHKDLYKLEYPNLTVIPADSSVSSYKLLDAADKIITFGSTMGIEATYSRKPSICVGPAFYEKLNVSYKPKDINELWSLIENDQLLHLYSDNVLIYGYYFMALYNSILRDPCNNIDNNLYKYYILGQYRQVRGYDKILGSKYLYILVRYLVNLINGRKKN